MTENQTYLEIGIMLTVSSSKRTISTIGNIIVVAAVFEIHIDKNIVTQNKPSVNLKMT